MHVFFAIAAMGPHFATIFLFGHMARNPESAPTLFPLVNRIMNFPKHGAMAMLLTGVLMVALHPAGWGMFKELWLAGSMVLFVFNVVYGRVKLEPVAKRLGGALAAGPVKAEEIGAMARQIDSSFHVMTLALIAIIALMIVRPTL
ncbi:MAG: DUF2269 family protein [Bacillota bacterium]